MSKIKTGGPAFPVPDLHNNGMTTTPTELLTPEKVADMHNASISDRHMEAVKPFTADVMRIMRDAGMTFHIGLPHDKVIEQMTRVVDLAYAEASIKAAVVFSAPTQQPLTDEQKDAARWRWLSWHIKAGWDEGKFTSLVRIVSDENRLALNASIDRMMAGDWSDTEAAHGITGSKKGGAA